ncbi:MAG: DUF4199 domain-containing protein [Lentimicrobiaceae bacterium]|nr:DUF4199 domain-containing protein [Lentimicrobiaceae bacterium]MCB9024481.1 DUF4199 domain-containing protein [Lentimicrobiaceae bacterium]MCO5265158.1 DUF4199 domain-containing protein [Lentimicrobium sp.]HPG33845.1 DUF4199 domain-containing protein [Lentimicrobium sp.]
MKKIGTEIKWALILTGAGLAWIFLERVSGLHGNHIDKHAFYTKIITILAVAIYIFALLDKKNRDYCGKISYLQAVVSGLIITAFITLISPLAQLIASNYISPDFFHNMIAYQMSHGLLTQPQAENFYSLDSYIIQGLLGIPFGGLVTSVVAAFFIRNKVKST